MAFMDKLVVNRHRKNVGHLYPIFYPTLDHFPS